MALPRGTRYRVHTYPSGKKVRLAIGPNGRILESTPVHSRVSNTRTGKRLATRRRRIS